MTRQVQVQGVVNSSDNKQALILTDDHKSSYTLVNPEFASDYNPTVIDWVDPSLVDYNFGGANESLSASSAAGLPLSFLQVATVEEGSAWYARNTRYPDLVCDMLAKYQWGDLRHTTPKEFRNQKKKQKKRQRAKKVAGPSLLRARGGFTVTFT